jgi:uncharacterized protein (TIGR03084 family)
MLAEVQALKDECAALDGLLTTLTPDDWQRPTPFKGWTPWDVVAHLHLSDQWAHAALAGRDAFNAAAMKLVAALQTGMSLTDYTRQHFAHLPGITVQAAWREGATTLLTTLATLDPTTRIAWFGPDMGARSFVTARYMEVWAHGQDIYDLLGRARPYTDAIHAIATLGVKTCGFTFRNRGLTPPEPPPYVRLQAPSGAIWEWNDPATPDHVTGLAAEFCHVVTQNRNVADTTLEVHGAAATRWMAMAQCFAGPPEDPPAPGTRVGVNAA